jgi:hypothetical protein
MVEMNEPMIVNQKDTLVKSFKISRLYDCQAGKEKFLSQTGHSESMGTGKVMLSRDTPDAQWKSIAPGNIQEAILEAVCAVK